MKNLDKKLIIGGRADWLRAALFVALVFAASWGVWFSIMSYGKSLAKGKPVITYYTDVITMRSNAAATFLTDHPEVTSDMLPLTINNKGTQTALSNQQQQVAYYVASKYPFIQAYGAVMLIPALIAILLRLITKEGFKNSGLRLGRFKNYMIVLGIIAGFFALSAALNALVFRRAPDFLLQQHSIQPTIFGLKLPITLYWIVTIITALLGNITVGLVAMFGEEYGWRPYLLQKLLPLGFWPASLITGFVWGLWHMPVILMGHNYGVASFETVALFIIYCMLLGTLFNYWYVRSNSVFVCAAAHGWHNGLVGIPLMLTMYMGQMKIIAPVGWLGAALLAVIIILYGIATKGYDIAPYIERENAAA